MTGEAQQSAQSVLETIESSGFRGVCKILLCRIASQTNKRSKYLGQKDPLISRPSTSSLSCGSNLATDAGRSKRASLAMQPARAFSVTSRKLRMGVRTSLELTIQLAGNAGSTLLLLMGWSAVPVRVDLAFGRWRFAAKM